MTNTLPDAPACAIIIRDTLLAAMTALATSARRITDPALDPFATITDDDDYAPARASIIRSLTLSTFDSIHDDARAALIALLADDDFIDDLHTADFDSPLFDLIPD